MKESYKQSAQRITVPSHLMESTAEKMKEALSLPPEEIQLMFPDESVTKQQKGKVIPFVMILAGLAAAAALVFSPSLLQKPAQHIITPLTAGIHQSHVELTDGELQFQGAPELTFHKAPSFGLGTSPVSLTMDDYQRYLGESLLPDTEILGFTLEKETLRVLQNQEGEILSDTLIRHYVGKEGESLTVEISKSNRFTQDYREKNFTSRMGETALLFRWEEENKRYTVEFDKHDYSLTCKATDLSQTDFIEIVSNFFK